MKKRIVILSALLVMLLGSSVEAKEMDEEVLSLGGCSNWIYVSAGPIHCSNEHFCSTAQAIRARGQNIKQKRNCVNANNKAYTQYRQIFERKGCC